MEEGSVDFVAEEVEVVGAGEGDDEFEDGFGDDGASGVLGIAGGGGGSALLCFVLLWSVCLLKAVSGGIGVEGFGR